MGTLNRHKRRGEEGKPEELQRLMPSSPSGHNLQPRYQMDSPKRTLFQILFGVSHALGILTIVLAIVWCKKFLGGFSWSVKEQEFNYHPIFMIIGMVYLYGNSILAYRVFPGQEKPKLKILHTFLHAGCLLFTAVGLCAVIDFHNRAGIPNFYSLHSWIGIGAVALYFLQWVGSFYAFLYPGMADIYRRRLMPLHITGGLVIFSTALAACATGLVEKALFTLKTTPTAYSDRPPAAWYINFIGVFLVLYGFLIGYLVTESDFKRQPLPTEAKTSSSNDPISMD